MRKGFTSTAFFQRKPLPDPDISPSQTSHLATYDPDHQAYASIKVLENTMANAGMMTH